MKDLIAFARDARDRRDYQSVVDLVPYARFLGMRFEEGEQGLLYILDYSEHNIGNSMLPALHGGVIGAFMEHSAILELVWNQQSDVLPKVIDFTIDYLRPGRPQTVYAQCRMQRQGQRVANVAIDAWQEDSGKPIATARTHFLLTPPQ